MPGMKHTTHDRSAIIAEPTTETSDAQANADAQPTLDARLAALDLTDVGNAARLVARYGHDLRYGHADQKWYVWDGTIVNEVGEGKTLKDEIVNMASKKMVLRSLDDSLTYHRIRASATASCAGGAPSAKSGPSASR